MRESCETLLVILVGSCVFVFFEFSSRSEKNSKVFNEPRVLFAEFFISKVVGLHNICFYCMIGDRDSHSCLHNF